MLANNFAQLHPLFQIWSLLAPKKQDGDSENANWRLQNISPQTNGYVPTATSIISAGYLKKEVLHVTPPSSTVEFKVSRVFLCFRSQVVWMPPPSPPSLPPLSLLDGVFCLFKRRSGAPAAWPNAPPESRGLN